MWLLLVAGCGARTHSERAGAEPVAPLMAGVSAQVLHPAGAVRCAPGERLLVQEADGRVSLFRVEDLVELERLLPATDGSYLRESPLLDSMVPAYHDEVYVLLTELGGPYRDAAEAEAAARQSAGVGLPVTIVPLRSLPADRVRVLSAR